LSSVIAWPSNQTAQKCAFAAAKGSLSFLDFPCRWPFSYITAIAQDSRLLLSKAAGESFSMKTRHDGYCTVFSALCNGMPWDGICTCGFGWQKVSEGNGNYSEMTSEEKRLQMKVKRLLRAVHAE